MFTLALRSDISLWEKILSAINSLRIDISDNLAKISEVRNIVSETNNKLTLLQKEVTTLKNENKQLKKINKQQNVKILAFERELRRKNLIIYGLNLSASDYSEKLSEILSFIKSNLGIDCNDNDIIYFRQLGRKPTMQPILIKFDSEKKKNDVFAKRILLKGTQFSLNEDVPQQIRNERKVLYAFLKKEVEKGNTVKMRYNYVIHNNKRLFYDDIVKFNTDERVKKKNTPRRHGSRADSLGELSQGASRDDDSSRPSTPKGLTQLEHWLGTPDRSRVQQVLKKMKTSESTE
ncbi:hypothetical protein O3M35_003380 [Rhynocoris fuscipes]|uniref:Endonuclease-reverse transcriptase n=1 Tax=Rhynocoris fuscipes TaxID=488301 RepID=A0AAW1CIR2_9HEMI